jgi:hypothetical protein
MKRSIVFCLIFATLFVTTLSVSACSSPFNSPSIDMALMWSDIFVKATIVEADDAHNNAILKIEYALKGETVPEYVLLYTTDPLLPAVRYRHSLTTACSYSGPHSMEEGAGGFFPLRRMANGAYESLVLLYTGLYYDDFNPQTTALINPEPETGIVVDETGRWQETNYKARESVSVPTEADFIALVRERGGVEPFAPVLDEWNYYPLYAPVMLTTDTGEKYMLPVDGGELVPLPDTWLYDHFMKRLPEIEPHCRTLDCLQFSPDDSVFTLTIDADTLQIGYSWIDQFSEIGWSANPVEIEGQTSLFAPNSDALAVWFHDRLDIYNLVAEYGGYGYIFRADRLFSLPLTVDSTMRLSDLHRRAVWSEDGTILVYADSAGLWLLDIYRSEQPRLIIPAENQALPLPMALSLEGRFLMYSPEGSQNSWILRDQITGEDYPNLLMTADGRSALYLAPQREKVSIEKTPSFGTSAWSVTTIPLQPGDTWRFEQIEEAGYYFELCRVNTGCEVTYCYPPLPMNESDFEPCQAEYRKAAGIISSDYGRHTGVIMLSHDLLIRWNFHNDYRASIQENIRSIERSDLSEETFVSVQWMPPLFYWKN